MREVHGIRRKGKRAVVMIAVEIVDGVPTVLVKRRDETTWLEMYAPAARELGAVLTQAATEATP